MAASCGDSSMTRIIQLNPIDSSALEFLTWEFSRSSPFKMCEDGSHQRLTRKKDRADGFDIKTTSRL